MRRYDTGLTCAIWAVLLVLAPCVGLYMWRGIAGPVCWIALLIVIVGLGYLADLEERG